MGNVTYCEEQVQGLKLAVKVHARQTKAQEKHECMYVCSHNGSTR